MSLLMEGEGEPEPILQTPFAEAHPAFSPDGKWLAYSSDVTGRREVYVRPFPAGAPEHRISTEGVTSPLWSPNGRELFYKTSEEQGITVMAVEVTAGATFVRGQPRPLFSGNYTIAGPVRAGTSPRTASAF